MDAPSAGEVNVLYVSKAVFMHPFEYSKWRCSQFARVERVDEPGCDCPLDGTQHTVYERERWSVKQGNFKEALSRR